MMKVNVMVISVVLYDGENNNSDDSYKAVEKKMTVRQEEKSCRKNKCHLKEGM